jgi:flagellar protein FliS
MGVQHYLEADIQSLSREKLLVLLYEKMGTDLLQARQAIADGDRITMADRISHSQKIVAELRNALDHTIGGEISRNLSALYDFLFAEHLAVLVDQDPRHVDNCLLVLKPLIGAWREIPPGTAEKAERTRSLKDTSDPGSGNPPGEDPNEAKNEEGEPDESAESRNPQPSLFSVSA